MGNSLFSGVWASGASPAPERLSGSPDGKVSISLASGWAPSCPLSSASPCRLLRSLSGTSISGSSSGFPGSSCPAGAAMPSSLDMPSFGASSSGTPVWFCPASSSGMPVWLCSLSPSGITVLFCAASPSGASVWPCPAPSSGATASLS